MRQVESDDDGTADMFDPFWVLFQDDDSLESARKAKAKRRQSQSRRGDHENTRLTRFEDFEQEDEFSQTIDDRESRDDNKGKQNVGLQKKQQHHWRRSPSTSSSAPKKESLSATAGLGIGGTGFRKVLSSTLSFPEIPHEGRDASERIRAKALETKNARTGDGLNDESFVDPFPPTPFPSLMDALSNPWDPWGDDETASSASSVGSFSSDGFSRNDESFASAMATTIATQSATATTIVNHYENLPASNKESREVQQILVKFNPVADADAEVEETTRIERIDIVDMPAKLSLPESSRKLPPTSYRDMASLLDASTLTSFDQSKPYNTEGFTNEYEIDPFEEEREPKTCLKMPKKCFTKDTESDKRSIISKAVFCMKQPSKFDDADRDDFANNFPKLRMVADEQNEGLKSTAIVANSKTFKGSVPAHLQLSSDTFLGMKGPQSLYEYEYDGGEHLDVVYNHFGPNPMSLLVIRRHSASPKLKDQKVVVQVEASTISMTDCSIRSGEWMGKDTPPLPITPGVDMVGKIFGVSRDVASAHNLYPGDRVLSLTRCGGNSRFLRIDPKQLVKIPSNVDIDPAQAVCLAETYLSAFQVLHFGQNSGLRYRSHALRGKAILIIGAVATNLGHAIVELAAAAGVEKIVATSSPKHFPHLRSLGIIPVSVDPALWYDQLNGMIDLVLVSNADEEIVTEHFKVLNETGRLIVIGHKLGSGIPMGDYETQNAALSYRSLVCKRNKAKVSMIERTHDYNPFRQWITDLEKSKKDLNHLVKLLAKHEITPNVLDRIPLDKVGKAQEMVESQRHPSGFLVCEPWLRNKKRAVRL